MTTSYITAASFEPLFIFFGLLLLLCLVACFTVAVINKRW